MKIEAGKFYRTRDNEIVGPMVARQCATEYKFKGQYRGCWMSWLSDGQFDIDRPGHARDLIADITWERIQPHEAEERFEWGKVPESDMLPGQIYPSADLLGRIAINVEPGYEQLATVLQQALDQSQSGKGKERHANDRQFDRQPIMEIGRMVGLGYPTGQASKKIQEAVGMTNRGEADRAVNELLGAIIYSAAAILLIREQKGI